MAESKALSPPTPFLKTSRTDAWWIPSLLTFLGLSFFLVYGTWAILVGKDYTYGPYISPLYGLELWGNSPHALFGKATWWPEALPFTPGIFIAWAPAGFRFTCYYYRGAYYKAFWADPVACTVGEPRSSYLGERWFPLVMQNIHRYFLYFALALMFVLAYDVWESVQFDGRFGLGVGSLITMATFVLLGGYTFGCHALRHLIGGRADSLPTGFAGACYDGVSKCNGNHMKWAWASLFAVLIGDMYVRSCAMGFITDLRIF